MNETDEAFRAEIFRDYLIEEGCAFHQHLAIGFLSGAEFYLKTLEEFIAKEEMYEIAALEKETERLLPHRRADFWADHYPIRWEGIFWTQLRASFVVSLTAFMEDYLKTVVEEVAIIQRISENPRSWRKDVLKKARKFLKEYGDFSEPTDREWNFLYNLYDLRNVLMHAGGSLHKSVKASELRRFISEEPGVSEVHGFIRLSKEFCFKALGSVRQLVLVLQAQQATLCKKTAST